MPPDCFANYRSSLLQLPAVVALHYAALRKEKNSRQFPALIISLAS